MAAAPTIVWFRDDLRLADNPALHAAVELGAPVLCLFVLDDSEELRPLGGASRWWLHHSLEALGDDIRGLGGALLLRSGSAATIVPELAHSIGAGAVLWNRRYGAAEREIDAGIKSELKDAGLDTRSFAANLLAEPWEIVTGQGQPYSVFTPFWKASLQRHAANPPRHPLPAPTELTALAEPPSGDELGSWNLLPTKPDWAAGLREQWTPGEAGADARLAEFLDDGVTGYAEDRDFPAQPSTSGLSPHLRFGEISSPQIWHAARDGRRHLGDDGATFLKELGWREFAYHCLFAFPDLATRNWRQAFDRFPWPDVDQDAFDAWTAGRTGIPLVDAGMRELWTTGTMHNRIRMVTASFLTKNLLIHWKLGEDWFWDTLVDADPASNPFNWQWVAGSGFDASPYFRIFNPERQRERFDADDAYIKRWVPEFGTPDYPEPIVDLGETRQAALAAYEQVKRA
ncbi:cryptochrome/photolyase family protein [Plantibacter sp. CFBP 8804]|uniref:cryptochrome/photolyase family protein n=1 Tax=Plantibacter sp. CFBP 8804 TaxID=2775270 RepID=UPI00178297F5|nr:deoxyribodipyrimidine photo-lyase [Plantibacter sp. CFBP 8804]MBD8517532.1 deoxyribodipyrimidine photo-lyase [Plantibacter sp. CFBP 8804]